MRILSCLILLLSITTPVVAVEVDCDSFSIHEALPAFTDVDTTGYKELGVYKVVDCITTVFVKSEALFNGRGVKKASLSWSEPLFTKEQINQIKNDPRSLPVTQEKEEAFTKSYPLINLSYADFAASKLSKLQQGNTLAYVLDNKVLFSATLVGPVNGTENTIYSAYSEEETRAIIEKINSFAACR